MQIVAASIFLLLFVLVAVFNISSKAEELPGNVPLTELTDSSETELTTITEAETTICTTAVTTVQEQEESCYIHYNVPLENDFQEYIQDVCKEYDFERFDIIIALIEKESLYTEKIISSTNDYGYMQINECNHEWLSEELNITDFLDGKQNVLAGIYLLSGLYEEYGNIEQALMAYGLGERGASKLWEQGIYSTEYIRSLMSIANSLQTRQ